MYVWKFGKLTALKFCVSLLLAGVVGVGFGVEGGLFIREAAHWCTGSTSTVFFTKSRVQQPFSYKGGK